MSTLSFEGGAFSGPADVRERFERRQSTRPWDEHPWDWAARFCQAHPEGRPWVDEALVGLLEARRAGGPLRPTERFDELFRTAGESGVSGVLGPLRRQLAEPLEGWRDEEVSALMGQALAAWGRDAFDDAERAHLVALVRGPRSLYSALYLLGKPAPERVVQLTRAHAADLAAWWPDHPDLTAGYAYALWLDELAPHRAALVEALAGLPEAARHGLLAATGARFASVQGEEAAQAVMAELAAAWGLRPAGADPEAARALAERFWRAVDAGDVPAVRALLVAPGDAALGPGFAEYATQVQAGAEAFVRAQAGRCAPGRVGAPAPMGASPLPEVDLLRVPVTLASGRDGSLMVYRLGAALKVGLMVRAEREDTR